MNKEEFETLQKKIKDNQSDSYGTDLLDLEKEYLKEFNRLEKIENEKFEKENSIPIDDLDKIDHQDELEDELLDGEEFNEVVCRKCGKSFDKKEETELRKLYDPYKMFMSPNICLECYEKGEIK